jgi:putative hydrolase of the HAD superfamily
MKVTPKLILFDLMNTLLEIDEAGAPYWHRIGEYVERMGFTDALTFNRDYTRSRPTRDKSDEHREVTLHERLAQTLPGISANSVSQLVAAYIDDYSGRTRPSPGVEEMLRAWHGKTPMAVVSNFFVPKMPQHLLEHHGLSGYFDFVIDSATLQIRKPNPQIFLAALREAEVSPRDAHEVLMIGDDVNADIRGAQAVGIKAMLFALSDVSTSDVPVLRSWGAFRPHNLFLGAGFLP